MSPRALAAFVFLTLVWGASFLWIKLAVADITPQSLVALRLVFGLLGLIGFVVWRRASVPRQWSTWRDLVALGLVNTALPWYLISWAEQSIDSALATVLNSTVPMFTILLAHVFLRDERITGARLLGVFLGLAGVLALFRRETQVANGEVEWGNWAGELAMLAATACYAASAVFARRQLRAVPALVQAFYSMAVATVVLWLVVWFSGDRVQLPTQPQTWIAVVWLGVLGAGLASYMFYYLLHVIGPTRTSFITYTIQVVGVALGVLILHEAFDRYLLVGTALILLGVWIVNRRKV